MTHAPHHATLEALMNGQNQFELVETRLGTMERWRANAMLIGETGGILSVYDAIRSDSIARADADKAREALIKHLCSQVDALTTRCDALASELETTKAEARSLADEVAARAVFDEEPLTLPPDLQEYQTKNPPAEIGDAETHHPGGDLHAVAAKEEPELEEREAEDNVGDLPEEIQLPKPLSEPAPEPKGSVQQQPIAVSLNEG
jgi:Tfp pilus assembly protein FimV